MQPACDLEETLPTNIAELKVLTEHLRFANMIETHKGGSEWVRVSTHAGRAFIRGLLKTDDIAVSDNYSSLGTVYKPHQHPGHEILVVYKGYIDLVVDGEHIRVNEGGKPYYFDATKEHSAVFPGETEYIAITIPGDDGWPEGG